MRYIPSPTIQAELVKAGLEQFCNGIEFEDAEWNAQRDYFRSHAIHAKESDAEIDDRTGYFLIWRDHGVPQDKSSGDAVETVNAKRITVMHETLRELAREHFPKLVNDFSEAKDNSAIQANAAKALNSQMQRVIEDVNASSCKVVSSIQDAKGAITGAAVEQRASFSELKTEIRDCVTHLAKVVFWGILGIAGLLLLIAALSLKAHSQIDVIQFQDSSGTLIKTFAAPFKIKCSTNLTCTPTGSTMAITAATGGAALAGGSNTQVQYNNATALGGISTMTTDGTIVTAKVGTNWLFVDPTDATKKAQFDASGISASTTRTFAFPDASGTFVLTARTVGTTSPITGGGDLSANRTIACATCVVASSPGAGIAHFAGSTQTVTSSAVVQNDVTNGYVDISSAQTITGAKLGKTLNTILLVDSANSVGWAGADAGAWINTARAACPANGCTILLGTGTFSYSTAIVLSASGVKLKGQGKDATKLTYTGAGVGLKVDQSTISLEDFTIDCTTGPASACVQYIDDNSASVANDALEKVKINGGTIGLDMQSTTANGTLWNSFYDLEVRSTITNALRMLSTSPGFVNQNTFHSCLLRTSTTTKTYALLNGTSGQVALNEFDNCDASFASGAGGIGYSLVKATDNVWINGDVESNTTGLSFDANSTNNRVFGVDTSSDTTAIADSTAVATNNTNVELHSGGNRFRTILLQATNPSQGDMIRWLDVGNLEADQYIQNGVLKIANGSNIWAFNANNGHMTVPVYDCKNISSMLCLDTTNTQGWTGADAGAQLNTIITGCAPNGCTIMLATGTYSFSTAIVINQKGIKIKGQGKDATNLTYTGTGTALTMQEQNTSLEDFTIDGSTGPSAVTIQVSDAGGSPSANSAVNRVKISGGTIGLDLNSTTANSIIWNDFIDLEIRGTVTRALRMRATSPGFVNENNFINCLLRTTANTGTYAELNGTNGQVALNNFYNCDAANASGVGGIGYSVIKSTDNTWYGGDVEQDATGITLDANSTGNHIFSLETATCTAPCIVDNTAVGTSNTGAFLTPLGNRFRSILLQATNPSAGDMIRWLDSGNAEMDEYVQSNQVKFVNGSNSWAVTMNSGATTQTGKMTAGAATTSNASINIPSGTAPTSPNAGDIWIDTSEEKHVVTTATAGAVKLYDSGGTNAITDTSSGTITSYAVNRPLVAKSGVQFGVNAANVITQDFSGDAAHALSQTAKTAAVTTFTLCAATAGTACGQVGQYRVSYNFWGSGTACATVTVGSVGLNLTWTDENAVAHTTISVPMWDQKSAANGILFNFNTALGTEGASGSYIISTNGTIIQAATTYTACTSGTGTYNLRMTVEQLQ